MAQSNYNIPNDSAPAVRAQLNAVFQSIATNNSGSSAPTTTFAHQWWYDTTTNILKQRNAADSAWIDIGTFDQTGGTFTPAGIVQLTQTQAEDSTSTVFGTVSGQRLAQAIAANLPSFGGLGVGQTWQTPSRAANTSYQNTTGEPIQVAVQFAATDNADRVFEVSPNNSTWTVIGRTGSGALGVLRSVTAIIPDTWYYRTGPATSITTWAELRAP